MKTTFSVFAAMTTRKVKDGGDYTNLNPGTRIT